MYFSMSQFISKNQVSITHFYEMIFKKKSSPTPTSLDKSTNYLATLQSHYTVLKYQYLVLLMGHYSS